MKLSKCSLKNFSSYKELDFDFSNLGLTLIQGVTGSGKSSLFDAPCWILFGVTAKNGSVDDVRGWYNLSEDTIGVLYVQLDKPIVVTRIRGNSSSKNDLYWTEGETSALIRGKDVTETQKLLNARMGIDSDLYLSAAYLCEFSPTGTFFLDKTKDQRELFEKIAPLELPIKIAERASDERKESKRNLAARQIDSTRIDTRLDQLRITKLSIDDQIENWKNKQSALIHQIRIKSENFEEEKLRSLNVLVSKSETFEKEKLESFEELVTEASQLELQLSTVDNELCPTCGKANNNSNRKLLLNNLQVNKQRMHRLHNNENPYLPQLAKAKSQTNHYREQLILESYKNNPFVAQMEQLEIQIPELDKQLTDLHNSIVLEERHLNSLNHLYALSFEVRAQLLKKSIMQIENQVNAYLDTHFESRIRAHFLMQDSDSLEIKLLNDGHECVYKQLSKGQRGLLKLCFAAAVMAAAANKSGVHFDNLFFDEALDGLDTDLKTKAFGLFQSLESNHGSILVIDHSTELKSMFSRQYEVTLNSDNSEIEAIDGE